MRLSTHPSRNKLKSKQTVFKWFSRHEESRGKFPAKVYDDIYNFVPLTSGSRVAKVCTDDSSLCCLAEFEAIFHNDTFSLGVFSGLHYEDGSVIGQFFMQMCTVMKCDPD